MTEVSKSPDLVPRRRLHEGVNERRCTGREGPYLHKALESIILYVRSIEISQHLDFEMFQLTADRKDREETSADNRHMHVVADDKSCMTTKAFVNTKRIDPHFQNTC